MMSLAEVFGLPHDSPGDESHRLIDIVLSFSFSHGDYCHDAKKKSLHVLLSYLGSRSGDVAWNRKSITLNGTCMTLRCEVAHSNRLR
ncbi:hypothetical protein RSAG8_09211, partial [Rhizoctonia solani AG-8 WAC10335]